MVNRQVTLSFNNATSEAACDITLFNELKVKKNVSRGFILAYPIEACF